MKKKVDTPAGTVSLVVDGAGDDLVVLAHGAGAPLDSEYMEFFADALATSGFKVGRFNFGYMERGRKSPDKGPLLEETFLAVVNAIRNAERPAKVVLGGKSMGGRIASQIAAGGDVCDGLVFLGYPLHPPGRPDRMRDAHLRDVKVPMLFVEGTRDPFCPLETLEKVTKQLPAPTEIVVVEDGDHSLKVRKSSGRSTKQAWQEAATAIAGWLRDRVL